MLGWFVKRRLAAYERDFNYDVGYMREMFDVSPRAFFRFSKIVGIPSYREDAPKAAWYAAKLIATLTEDCGPCTQLVVTMAERDGVDPACLWAVVSGDESRMPADAALDISLPGLCLAAILPRVMNFAAKLSPVGAVRQWSRLLSRSLLPGCIHP